MYEEEERYIEKLIDCIAQQSSASGTIVDLLEEIRAVEKRVNWNNLDQGNRAAAEWLYDWRNYNSRKEVLAVLDRIMSESGETERREKWGKNFRST